MNNEVKNTRSINNATGGSNGDTLFDCVGTASRTKQQQSNAKSTSSDATLIETMERGESSRLEASHVKDENESVGMSRKSSPEKKMKASADDAGDDHDHDDGSDGYRTNNENHGIEQTNASSSKNATKLADKPNDGFNDGSVIIPSGHCRDNNESDQPQLPGVTQETHQSAAGSRRRDRVARKQEQMNEMARTRMEARVAERTGSPREEAGSSSASTLQANAQQGSGNVQQQQQQQRQQQQQHVGDGMIMGTGGQQQQEQHVGDGMMMGTSAQRQQQQHVGDGMMMGTGVQRQQQQQQHVGDGVMMGTGVQRRQQQHVGDGMMMGTSPSRVTPHKGEGPNHSITVNDGTGSPPTETTPEEVTTTLVEAFRVEEGDGRAEEDVEETVRRRILQEAVQAEAVIVEDNQGSNNNIPNQSKDNKKMMLGLVALLLVLAVVVGLALGLSPNSVNYNDNGAPQVEEEKEGVDQQAYYENLTTLQDIRQRGFLRCGVYADFPGFSFHRDGNWSGFNYEICRALSAAVFDGDATKVEPVVVNAANRFVQLSNRSLVDALSQAITFTLGRDVVEQSSQQGFTFSYPFYFSGLVFGGVGQYVDCADQLDSFNGICRGLKVCVAVATTQEALVRDLLPGAASVPYSQPMEVVGHMMNSSCNVIAAEAILLNPTRMQEIGFNIPDYKLGNNTFSRDPLTIVTRDGIADRSWSNLVNSVIQILFTAEAMNLTKENVGQYDFERAAAADGQKTIPKELQDRMIHVIEAVGNYNEMYQQQVRGVIDLYRSGSNLLNRNWDSGLLQHYPYGEMDMPAPEPVGRRNDTTILETIQERGYLMCGIVIGDDRLPGLAEYNATTQQYYGMDVEYCRGLSAALFVGDTTKVQFVRLRNGGDPINNNNATADSSTENLPFVALSNGLVDVLAGQEVSLTNQYFEPTTGGLSFTFSEPYFYYKTSETQVMLAMATRQGDEGDYLWSSFVYWVGMSIVYAEEMGIRSLIASEMPTVNVFGNNYIQSFRDCIYGVGNYEEIYNRTLQETTPRSGGNLLNTLPFGPQQVGFPLI